MKQNKKWQVILLSGLIMITLTACGKKVENPQITTESPVANHQSEDSIYNNAYEKYSDITELGVIINNPTEKDYSQLTDPQTFTEPSDNNQQECMLIIPKYNGSKITVSSAEYTGEQYIAKDVLFSKESTSVGYGLRLCAQRPKSVPKIIVTINYQNMSCKYAVLAKGNGGATEVEYLRLETDASGEKQGEPISLEHDTTYLKGLNLFSSSEIDIDKDGEKEVLELYCDGYVEKDGDYALDDGQNWTLILRKGDSFYILFNKAYIQFGKLEYIVYQDYKDYEKTHILLEYKSGTAIYYYDCTFDDESGNMLRNDFFDADSINMLGSSE